MKTCRKCGATKPLTEFHTHPETLDGYLNHCAACVRARVREWRARNAERIRAKDVERAKSPERRAHSRQVTARSRKEHPEKTAAHNAVMRALASGRLVRQPCEVCDTTARVHAHHDDYSRPLDVAWLCPLHHKARHAQLEAQA